MITGLPRTVLLLNESKTGVVPPCRPVAREVWHPVGCLPRPGWSGTDTYQVPTHERGTLSSPCQIAPSLNHSLHHIHRIFRIGSIGSWSLGLLLLGGRASNHRRKSESSAGRRGKDPERSWCCRPSGPLVQLLSMAGCCLDRPANNKTTPLSGQVLYIRIRTLPRWVTATCIGSYPTCNH